MAPEERKKAIKGVLLLGVVGLGFLGLRGAIVGMASLPPPAAAASEAPAPSGDKENAASGSASGEHCLSGWDGSFPRLKDAVKRQLRNPRSFEHMETVRSRVDGKGTFGLIMTYRAENGFGGMNVEAIGVEVNAKTCDFKRASNEALARRLRT